MTAVPLRLPSRVAMIPSSKAMERLARDREQGRGTDPAGLAKELTLLSFGGGIPARVDETADEPRLLLYTERYVLWLSSTDFGNGYRLGHVEPINLKDHERLLGGALLLQGPGWQAFQNIEDIPENSASHWDLIAGAWSTTATAEPAASGPPPHHQRCLDLLAEVVEATRAMEVTKQGAARPLHYRAVDTAREDRQSARDVRTFHLLRPSSLVPGSRVQVDDDPELRGKVLRCEGKEVVVRLDVAAALAHLPAQGTLQLVPDERVYQTQLDAIDLLRQRRAANPNLMTALVDHQLAYFQPDRDAVPRLPLDSGQLEALQRSLTVPDVLLVLGPPGTGKTRTITEIATACAALGRRVLVTAHTTRAVDNVLQDLSSLLRCIRVGDVPMAGDAPTFTVEAQVDELADGVRRTTEGMAAQLSPVATANGPVHLWLNFLETRLAEARTCADEVGRCRESLAAVSQRVSAPIGARLRESETVLTRCRAAVDKLERAVARQRRRRQRAAARAASAESFQDFYRRLAERSVRRLAAAEQELADARTALADAETASAALRSEVRDLVGQDEEGAQLVAAESAAKAALNSALAESSRATAALRSDLRGVLDLPADDPADLPAWEGFASALRQQVTALHRKASLLAQWRARVPEAEHALRRELVQFADVVAATCDGAATTELLTELDFDLAVVDEAGQLSLPAVLVPLVRARRAVLVGDHQQLPPFLDDDVDQWAKRLVEDRDVAPTTAAEIGKILRKSAFEGLHDVMGPDHRVPLTVQRRMPEALAEFVSHAFYDGVLRTEHPGSPEDPLFSSALALVDTEDRPPALRSERRADHDEEWNLPGYVNELEATVITNLITHYVRHYDDWAVIVPYRAQAFRIRKLLTEQLGDAVRVENNVATVDSFQGGERDLVVYGFTRSNQTGDVGFLKELRRINVAMTRTKQQLVLVGDTATLLQSNDKEFAELMRALDEHLREYGDIRRSRELEAELKRLAEGAS